MPEDKRIETMRAICACCPTRHCESGHPCDEVDMLEIMHQFPEEVCATYAWLYGNPTVK